MNADQRNRVRVCECGKLADKQYIVGNCIVCKRCYDSYQEMKKANHTRGRTCGHVTTNSFIEPYSIHISNRLKRKVGLL